MVEAKNAVRYGFQIENNSEFKNTTGELAYIFKTNGINQYNIIISAYSNTNEIITISSGISVGVFNEEEQQTSNGLLWSDEFETNGRVSESNWISEIVPQVNGGWFNTEQQHYANRTENSYISNGTLKIVAKKEVYTAFNSTKNYTSARLNSLFSFTYGRIEVRAKLPEGSETWPAIWSLGTNLNAIGWLICGEIDIMEHVGNNIDRVSAGIHTPSSQGNSKVGYTNITKASSAFHVYKVDWTAEKMNFYVDGIMYCSYNPEVKNSAT